MDDDEDDEDEGHKAYVLTLLEGIRIMNQTMTREELDAALVRLMNVLR